MAKRVDKHLKLKYPPQCKELNEELSKDELVQRLKLVAEALQNLAQGVDENKEFMGLALYLASEFFMEHSSKDVRLLVACCIADVFRVFAPEAPYTEPDHLKDIFRFITQQLKGLSDPESPAFARHYYLLENLALVKSFNICLELEDNQELLHELFKLMFAIISEKHSTKVFGCMLDVMCPLLAEADSVSQGLLDLILGNILEPFKSQNRPAYNLAKDLIMRSASAIEPDIQTFFSNALMLGKTGESDLSDRLFDLIEELNYISRNVLVAVFPQLEFKLKSGDESERLSATRLLAKMFSEPKSELALLCKPLWTCFVGRFNDIDINIRRLCTQSSQEFIVNHPELISDVPGSLGIGEHLHQRQHDSDENVRMDVVQAIVGAAKRELANVPDDLLECVKERTLDKKFKIRKEALIGLGQIYRRCYEADKKGNVNRVAWVRNKVLHAYYHNSVDDKVMVERILNTSLVPYSLEPAERMKRLYILYASLDEHAVKALQEIFKTQLGLRNLVRTLYDLSQKAGSDEVDQSVKTKLVQISRYLSEPQKCQEPLKKFIMKVREDARIRGSLLKLISPGCSCKKAEECVKEIIRKLGNPLPNNLLYTTVKQLLERISPLMIDSAAILALVNHVHETLSKDDDSDGNRSELISGMKLLLLFTNVYQSCFDSEAVFRHLLSFVKCEDDVISDSALQIFRNVCSNLEHMFPTVHASLLPVLQKTVKIGTGKQAKHAIRCIDAMCRNKDVIFKQLYEHLEKNMNVDAPNFLTSLVSIGHLSLLCPKSFAASTSIIVSKFIVNELLLQDRTVCRKSNENWYADHLVSEETQAKIQGLKLITRWLLGIRNNDNSRAIPAFRLLYSMILSEGDLTEGGKINKAEMARLRLQAGCCMLKLAQEPVYADAIRLEQFETMALLVNDPCYEVRVQFVQKLHKGLIALRLPLQYLGVLCLGALDPLKERRGIVKQMFAANVTRRREYLKQNMAASGSKLFSLLPDYVLPYAVHLLAHDPDFTTYDDVNALKGIKDCLVFMIDPLLTKNDTISFNFYRKMLENIKQTKDVQCPDSEEANKKLYAICDLALNLIKAKASSFSLTEFPAEPVLPSKLYTQPDLSNPNNTVYLPAEFLSGHVSKLKKPTAAATKPPENKRKNTSTVHDSSRSSIRSRIESPDSSVSSNPSSPVSSTKSSPLGLSERNRLPLRNKLHSARAITKAQPFSTDNHELTKRSHQQQHFDEGSSSKDGEGGSSSAAEDMEHLVSGGSSSRPPSRSTAAAKKSAAAAKKQKTSNAKKKAAGAAGGDKKLTQGKMSDFLRRSSTRSSRNRNDSEECSSSAAMSSSSKPESADEGEEEQQEIEDEERKEQMTEEEEEAKEEVKSMNSRKKRPSRAAVQDKKKSMASTLKPKTNVRLTSKRGGGQSDVSEEGGTGRGRKRQRDSSQESVPQSTSVKRLRQSKSKIHPEGSSSSISLHSPSLSSASKSLDTSSSLKRNNNKTATTAKRSRSGSLLNGTSDVEDESSGSGKKPKMPLPSAVLRRRKGVLAIKRREGAAAKVAQRYADFEVPVGIITPKKKR